MQDGTGCAGPVLSRGSAAYFFFVPDLVSAGLPAGLPEPFSVPFSPFAIRTSVEMAPIYYHISVRIRWAFTEFANS